MSIHNLREPPRPKVGQYLVLNKTGSLGWRIDAITDELLEAKHFVANEVHPDESTIIVKIESKRNYF